MRGDNRIGIEYGVTDEQVIGVLEGFYRNGTYVNCEDARYLVYCYIWEKMYVIRWGVSKMKGLFRMKH